VTYVDLTWNDSNILCGTARILSLNLALSSSKVAGRVSNTGLFRYPHKTKSDADKSEDFDGQVKSPNLEV
jgi:hypothetical protein